MSKIEEFLTKAEEKEIVDSPCLIGSPRQRSQSWADQSILLDLVFFGYCVNLVK